MPMLCLPPTATRLHHSGARDPAPRRLAKGWQYIVYDLGNGRVRKKPRSLPSLFPSLLFSSRKARPLGSHAILREAKHLKRQAREATDCLSARKHLVDAGLFGYPKLFADGSYEQDLVVTLGDHLQGTNRQQKKSAIEKLIALQHACWEYGLGDPGFDFANNTGVDAHGRVIQIDLGELASNRDALAHSIGRKVWLIQDSFLRRRDDRSFCELFSSLMEEAMKTETLDALWGRKLRTGQRPASRLRPIATSSCIHVPRHPTGVA